MRIGRSFASLSPAGALALAPGGMAPDSADFVAFVALGVALVLAVALVVAVRRLRRARARVDELESQLATATAELAAADLRLGHEAQLDGLTGLTNRRAFDDAFEIEWRRAERQAAPLALLLIDLDRFHAYNERFGPLVGDACLQAIARTTQTVLRRAGEVVARFGGEELAALLPGATEEVAAAAAEKLRRAVAALTVPNAAGDAVRVTTVSLGVAVRQPGQVGPLELLAAADRALYRAKQRGRDRVEVEGASGS